MKRVFVEVFPASYGDCMLLRIEEPGAKAKNILIDCGLAKTYKKFLKPRLKELKKMGEEIDLLIITHVDADHITGAINLLKENGSNQYSKIIKINEIWHNSFKNLYRDIQDESLNKVDLSILNNIRVETQHLDEDEELEAQDISVNQGSHFASLILKGGYSWNSSFGNQSIFIKDFNPITIMDDIKVTLLSPTYDALEKLKNYWEKELRSKGYDKLIQNHSIFEDIFEGILLEENESTGEEAEDIASAKFNIDKLSNERFFPDESVTNGSSIVILLEIGQKKLLFMGDTHSDVLESTIKHLPPKVLKNLDLVKISHHGSKYNNGLSLYNMLSSKKYLITTDGSQYGHPHLETLARIIKSNEMTNKSLVFNYPLEKIAPILDKTLMEEHGYEVVINEKEQVLIIEID
ncbi:ComEC/Rec2 family competence protein [Bacillus paranthracis]|uniref:ComEC/Rec2 family competence protein n=1 Tax=Bacillus cereus group TaxID=86661 RepID=UPI000D6BFADD|nr:MBL fold metallo-hydrolase [Bacillus paranthracis]PWN74026.1 hypothetical protein CV741_20930 [Bacillus cereus]PWN79799.1 hypothetical protein CV717_05150 [Bacillus cereus]UHJ48954.1 MBL fold metallo-hydrolase [Bacillus paranthracis]